MAGGGGWVRNRKQTGQEAALKPEEKQVEISKSMLMKRSGELLDVFW